MSQRPAPPPSLRDLDAIAGLVQRLQAHAAGEPALAEARLEELIRLVPGKRAILAGRVGGRPAIFRFHIDDPRRLARRDWQELTRAQAHMGSGEMRVNAPIAHLPDLGLVVVERVAGTPLLAQIWRTARPERARYLRPAAEWLRKYTAPTETLVPARLQGWERRAEAGLARLPFRRLHPLKTAILAELRRIGAPREGRPWRVAVCHGDFHPNNLIIDGTRLTGIDTGGSARLPIYKDMARFLAHMGRRGLVISGRARFGVDAAGIDAFAELFGLDGVERGVWLPYMIGIEALVRVEARSLSKSRIRRAQTFCETLLEELRAVPA